MAKKKKLYKTTVTIEFIHEGEFESYDSSSLQTPGAIEHLGQLNSQNTDPVILSAKTKSSEISADKAAEICGEDWVEMSQED